MPKTIVQLKVATAGAEDMQSVSVSLETGYRVALAVLFACEGALKACGTSLEQDYALLEILGMEQVCWATRAVLCAHQEDFKERSPY